MKKGLIIAIAVVVAILLIVGGIVIANSFAPDFTVEGTYKAENGDTATVSADKITFSNGKEISIEAIDFAFFYMGSAGDYQFRCFNSEEGEIVIHQETVDGKSHLFFGFDDVQYDYAD